MRVLVTGATGYIGSHLVKSLAEWGNMVYATDFNMQQNNIEKYIVSGKPTYCDIRHDTNYSSGKFFGYTQFDVVVHCAAATKVSLSVTDPYNYYLTNIVGTQNIINHVEFDHFIYCSTGSAFQPGSSPYATSKRAAEDLVSILPKYTITRFYNVSGNDGMRKYDDGYFHLIRKAAAVANRKFPKLDIYGTDWETRDGTTVRNYTHIKDIVDATVAIVHNGPTNKIECLGTKRGSTVREVVAAMKSISWDFPTEDAPRRPGEVAISTMPEQSRFFVENESLVDMCKSAMEYEK
jgi:UDP-glucose 4-epimerase